MFFARQVRRNTGAPIKLSISSENYLYLYVGQAFRILPIVQKLNTYEAVYKRSLWLIQKMRPEG